MNQLLRFSAGARVTVMALTVRGKETRCKSRIAGREVEKYNVGKLRGLVNLVSRCVGVKRDGTSYNKDTGRKDHNANGRCDPVNLQSGCPGKDE